MDEWDRNAKKLIKIAGKYLKEKYGNKAILKNGNVRTSYLIKEIDKLDQISAGILSDKREEEYSGIKPFKHDGRQEKQDEYDEKIHSLLWRVLTLKTVPHKKLREYENKDYIWYKNKYYPENKEITYSGEMI